MKTLSRSEAIRDIRGALLGLVDEEHSICEVAARLHIFCGGFAQWTFHELKQRYPMIVRSRQRLTRQALEELANRWQIARQTALGTEFSCDTQLHERDDKRICRGWEEFSDEELAAFYAQLVGQEVSVADGPGEPVASRPVEPPR